MSEELPTIAQLEERHQQFQKDIDHQRVERELREREATAKLRQTFLESVAPNSIRSLKTECLSFLHEFINGDKKASLAIGRDVVRRWWDCMSLTGEILPSLPILPPVSWGEAWVESIMTKQDRRDELQAVVNTIVEWCNARLPEETLPETVSAAWLAKRLGKTADAVNSKLSRLRENYPDCYFRGMDAAAPKNSIGSYPLWRLVGMLDDAEKNGDSAAAKLLTRVVRARLRSLQSIARDNETAVPHAR